MNTTESNKLIAEFLGFKEQKDPTERWFGRFFIPAKGWYKENELAFNHDWNWLMEVVEKIESLEHCQITIIKNWCRIEHAKYNSRIDSRDYSEDFTKIEAVYNACVTFIEWYNENK